MPETSNLKAALKKLGRDLGLALGNRVELASLELAEERRRAFRLLGWFLAAAFFCMMSLVFLTLVIIFLFWEEHHRTVLAITASLYTVIAIAALLRLRGLFDALPPVMGDTIRELKKDGACLFTNQEDTPNRNDPS